MRCEAALKTAHGNLTLHKTLNVFRSLSETYCEWCIILPLQVMHIRQATINELLISRPHFYWQP
jgi:hypothetical protein